MRQPNADQSTKVSRYLAMHELAPGRKMQTQEAPHSIRPPHHQSSFLCRWIRERKINICERRPNTSLWLQGSLWHSMKRHPAQREEHPLLNKSVKKSPCQENANQADKPPRTTELGRSGWAFHAGLQKNRERPTDYRNNTAGEEINKGGEKQIQRKSKIGR